MWQQLFYFENKKRDLGYAVHAKSDKEINNKHSLFLQHYLNFSTANLFNKQNENKLSTR